jgi:uroporphyrinogen-III decarboxylase
MVKDVSSPSRMSVKERLLSAIRLKEVDRVPFSPFLAYWWDFAPQKIQEKGQFRFMKEIGADPLLRGQTVCFRSQDILGLNWGGNGDGTGNSSLEFKGCDIRYTRKDSKRQVRWETPIGTLEMEHTWAEAARSWMISSHPVKTVEDYKILLYLIERMTFEADYSEAAGMIKEVGDEGLVVAQVSPFLKTPFQSLIEHFVGTVQLVYDLYDHPDLIAQVTAVMNDKAREAVEISVESPVEAFISWEDSSTMNVHPDQFEKYIASELRKWGAALHREGKLLLHHACGHIKDLLPMMAEEGVDAVESISPPPTGNTHIWEAQKILSPAGTAVIGGIDPVMLETMDEAALRTYVREILRNCSRRGLVLANSDSCPPDVKIESFMTIVEEVGASATHQE